MYYIIHIQNPVYYCKFRDILLYARRIPTYSVILWYILWYTLCTLALSEPCHVHNPVIFRTQDIFKTLSYQGIFRHLGILRHILAYPIMIVIIALTSNLILHTFQRDLKRYVF